MPRGVAWGCISPHEYAEPVETQWRAEQGGRRQTCLTFIHTVFRNGPWSEACLHVGPVVSLDTDQSCQGMC